MTALSIQPPFPLLTDIDGQPLEDGYIWIGVANLPPIGNPIAVYWDAALTQPAALPVRTRGGYPVNAGTPARLYVGSDYSIQVQNKNGSVIYSAPDGASDRFSAAQIEFLQAGLGAVVRTVQSKLRDTVSVKDFGAVGDGVADDTAAIQAAISSGAKAINFPTGTYNCGNVSAAQILFSLNGSAGPISLTNIGNVKFVCTTTDSSIPTFFQITNAINVSIGSFSFQDLGYNNAITWKGAAGISLVVTDGNPIQNVNIQSIYAKNLVNPVVVSGTSTTRCTGINIGTIFADDCYYGLNLQNNGDFCTVGLLYAKGCSRSSFIYGVTDYRANIYSDSNLLASSDCLIQAYSTGYDTNNVAIKYTARNPTNVASFVSMQIFGESSKTISNVELDLDVVSATGADLITMRAYNASGTVENTGATTNIWTGIKTRFVGSTAGATRIALYCLPNTKGSIDIGPGFPFNLLQGITQYFSLTNSPTGTFTPAIVGTGTPGVGTYSRQSGRFTIIGNRVFYDINLVWSAHTGTGPYMRVTGLPIICNASANYAASATFFSDIAVGAGKQLGASVDINNTIIQLYQQDVAGGAADLLAFDTAGTLYLSGNYEI
jgi:hypothetical protein